MAMSAAVSPQDFSEIRWRGHWIWTPEEKIEPSRGMGLGAQNDGREKHGLFRKTVMLESVPSRVPTRITADSRYVLYVNGQEVFRGPIRSQPRRLHYDLFDLAPYLVPGRNTLAVHVKYYGTAKSYWMPAAPNMTLGKTGVLVFEAGLGEDAWLVSDASWRARLVDAWDGGASLGEADPIAGGVPVEVFDARRMAVGWQQPDFDDAAWGAAQVVPAVHIGGFARTQPPTDPYGPMVPRPIAKLGGMTRQPQRVTVEALDAAIDTAQPHPTERVWAAARLPVAKAEDAPGLPVEIDLAAGPVRVTLDMGVIVAGLVEFEVVAPAGTVFDIAYMEEPPSAVPPMIRSHAGTRYVARGHDDRHVVSDPNGLRYAYVLVHGTGEPVKIHEFAVREYLYPWQEGASFSCSDERLNRLYTAGIRTVALNSHDAFMDCPTREQRSWVGDSVVHQMVHLATNLDWRLAWHYLALSNSPRSDGALPMSVAGDVELAGRYTIPDWALHWVHGVYNLYRFGGDRDTVKAYMPTIERVLRWYAPYQTAGGALKDVPEWNLVDWSSVSNADTSALLTALWARGLAEFAEMAAWLEEQSSRRWAAELYARARTGFEIFWDEARGSYVDHVVDGEQRPEMSQLAGALAIVSGLAPAARWRRIVETITDPARVIVRSWSGGDGEYQMQKMMKQFQGIYEADWDVAREVVSAEPFMSYTVHDAIAQAGLADALPDMYLRWLEFLVDGYDTIGECWGWGTHVHGWSCTPTRDMVFYTLGITPASPGYATARIAPRLGRLEWAKGTAPTPHGLIQVEATRTFVVVESPIPVILDLEGQARRELPAGRHVVEVV
jgi:hypothetical protein